MASNWNNEYDEQEEEFDEGVGYDDGTVPVAGGLPPPPNPPTPSVWEQDFDEDSGAPFWYNRLTGESSWEEPEELASASAPAAASSMAGPPHRSAAVGSAAKAAPKSSVQQAEAAVDLPQYVSSDFRTWDIMTFCQQKLKPVAKSFFTKPRTVAEQMKWAAELKHPLHHGQFPDKAMNAQALKMFQDIAYYCGDRKGKYGPGALVYCQAVIKKALAHPMLADEFFLQLIKQTRNNPDTGDQASANVADQASKRPPGAESSMAYLYQLFALAGGCMVPSEELWTYLDVFLAKSESSLSGIPAESQKNARFAREQLLRSRQAGTFRVLPPNRREHQAVLRRHPVFLRVNLLDGTHITTKVYCQTTIRELVQQIASKMAVDLPNFLEYPCFGIFQQAFDKSKFISENTLQEDVRVNDILAVQDEATKHNAESTMRFDMVFKAKLFLSHMWDELDVNAINLYFLQAMYDITNDLMPLAEPQAMQVAALQLHNLYPGALPPTSEDRVNDWLPSRFRVKIKNTKKRAAALQQLVNQIIAVREKEGYTEQKLGGPPEAKRALLGLLHRGVAMYGCTAFLCVHVADVDHEDWDYQANALRKVSKNELAAMRARHDTEVNGGVAGAPGDSAEEPFRRNRVPKSKTLLVGVNEKGITWFDRKTRELRRFDKMQWIHTQGASDTHFVYVATNRLIGDRGKRTQVFETKHASKILDLVRIYRKVPGFEVEKEPPAAVNIVEPVHTYDYGYGGGAAPPPPAGMGGGPPERKEAASAAAAEPDYSDYSGGAVAGGHDYYADYGNEEEDAGNYDDGDHGGDYDYNEGGGGGDEEYYDEYE